MRISRLGIGILDRGKEKTIPTERGYACILHLCRLLPLSEVVTETMCEYVFTANG